MKMNFERKNFGQEKMGMDIRGRGTFRALKYVGTFRRVN